MHVSSKVKAMHSMFDFVNEWFRLFFALDPNPFANILNSPANAQFPLSPIHFQFNPLTTIPMNPIPPPPMPPFAFTQPPNVPHNLDQLTDEELRILEGTERRSIEERIKVCAKRQILFRLHSFCVTLLFFSFSL